MTSPVGYSVRDTIPKACIFAQAHLVLEYSLTCFHVGLPEVARERKDSPRHDIQADGWTIDGTPGCKLQRCHRQGLCREKCQDCQHSWQPQPLLHVQACLDSILCGEGSTHNAQKLLTEAGSQEGKWGLLCIAVEVLLLLAVCLYKPYTTKRPCFRAGTSNCLFSVNASPNHLARKCVV